jgi:starch phosphorylase
MTGFTVQVLFLDTDLPENESKDRNLSHYLYGGDQRYRLCQEYVLGVGGVRLLRTLGYEHIDRFHMNEGHAAFLILQLFDEELNRTGGRKIKPEHIEMCAERACSPRTRRWPPDTTSSPWTWSAKSSAATGSGKSRDNWSATAIP